MTPSRLHDPPRPFGASHNVCGGPPLTEIFFSFPSPKNPTNWLSGDQNGKLAPVVPSSDAAFVESRARIHSCVWPEVSVAGKTSRRPSGEMALPSPSVVPSGGRTERRTTRCSPRGHITYKIQIGRASCRERV